MRAKASARSRPPKLAMFAGFPDSNVLKNGTEQVRWVLRVFLAVATYAEKDISVRGFIYTFLRPGQISVAPSSGDQFLITVLNFASQGAIASLNVTTSFISEVQICLHCMVVVEKSNHTNTLKYSCLYSTGTPIGNTV